MVTLLTTVFWIGLARHSRRDWALGVELDSARRLTAGLTLVEEEGRGRAVELTSGVEDELVCCLPGVRDGSGHVVLALESQTSLR